MRIILDVKGCQLQKQGFIVLLQTLPNRLIDPHMSYWSIVLLLLMVFNNKKKVVDKKIPKNMNIKSNSVRSGFFIGI